ncbi:MAG: serine/threonine-protein kinase [Acidobacteriota bacterium]
MDPARWRRIETLFHRVRCLPPDRRARELEAERGRDADAVEAVEGMLASAEEAEGLLGGILEDAAEEAVAPPPGLDPLPERLGPYEVLGLLGRGGFSAVYLARPPADPHQRVAVKVLRRSPADPDLAQRFVQESEILARLHHPGIARFLGHGTTDLGEPYLVMEHVEGDPIDVYCDARGLDLRGRLALLGQVCEAVDFAHRNLVIHRDLKPGNLLVTRDGRPKLLDFGIAKLTEPNLLRTDPVVTAPGSSFLTPDYASPEQVRGQPLTTSTDVYSLGVLLYRLLCGRPPHRLEGLSMGEIEAVHRRGGPSPPSQVALTRPEGTDDSGAIARRRGTTPKGLRALLRGDLDSIALTALGPSPEDRYPSAAELARDLERHLRSEPVRARRLTTLYRARKFVRRHRVGVAVVALVVSTLGLAVVSTTRASWRAEAERARAERHLAESRQVTRFLVDLFERPDPEGAQGRDVTAMDLLEEGVGRIAVDLEQQPEVRSALMTTMGKVYRNLGDPAASRELLERALAERRGLFGPSDPRLVEGRQELARSLLVQGELATARILLRGTLAAQGEAEDPAASAKTLGLLAEVEKQAGKPAESEGLFRRALELQRQVLADDDPEVVDHLTGLAQLLVESGDLDAAEGVFRRALEHRRARLGDRHPDVATNLGDLAVVLHGQGLLEEAEAAIREALRIRLEVYGEDHWLLGKSYNNLAQVLVSRGRPREAIPWMRRALELGRERLGPEHPRVAERWVNLALTHQRAGQPEEAEAAYLEALDLHRRTLGEQHPSTVRNLYNLAGLYAEIGRSSEALDLLDRVSAAFRGMLPEGDFRLSYPLYLRGRILVAEGNCAGGVPPLERALELRLRHRQDDHADVAQVRRELDRCVSEGAAVSGSPGA